MTAKERQTLQQLTQKVDYLSGMVDQYIRKDIDWKNEFNDWRNNFVQPLVKEKADRTAVENCIKKYGKVFATLLGIVVSILLFFKYIIEMFFTAKK